LANAIVGSGDGAIYIHRYQSKRVKRKADQQNDKYYQFCDGFIAQFVFTKRKVNYQQTLNTISDYKPLI
jgi:hypothetical protein